MSTSLGHAQTVSVEYIRPAQSMCMTCKLVAVGHTAMRVCYRIRGLETCMLLLLQGVRSSERQLVALAWHIRVAESTEPRCGRLVTAIVRGKIQVSHPRVMVNLYLLLQKPYRFSIMLSNPCVRQHSTNKCNRLTLRVAGNKPMRFNKEGRLRTAMQANWYERFRI